MPGLLANLVGAAESVCDKMILLSLSTRLAAADTATIMTVAIITTKVPIWMGAGFGPFEVGRGMKRADSSSSGAPNRSEKPASAAGSFPNQRQSS